MYRYSTRNKQSNNQSQPPVLYYVRVQRGQDEIGRSGMHFARLHSIVRPIKKLTDNPRYYLDVFVLIASKPGSKSIIHSNSLIVGVVLVRFFHSFPSVALCLSFHASSHFPVIHCVTEARYTPKMAASKSIDRHAIVGGSADRTAIVGEATKLMFESDTLEDPRTRSRTVPFEVICPGMPRTGTSCKPSNQLGR